MSGLHQRRVSRRFTDPPPPRRDQCKRCTNCLVAHVFGTVDQPDFCRPAVRSVSTTDGGAAPLVSLLISLTVGAHQSHARVRPGTRRLFALCSAVLGPPRRARMAPIRHASVACSWPRHERLAGTLSSNVKCTGLQVGRFALADQLAEAFNLFDQRLQPSALQRNAAELRGHHVSQLLSRNSQILECRLVGSLVRSTAIQRFSDVDILAIFDPKEVDPGSPEKFLDLTEQIVGSFSRAAARTSITIFLKYSDWPSIDILPGWAVSDGKRQEFRIPAGTGQAWQLYSPSQHDRIIRDGSARLGLRFKSIIRMIKWWNRLNGSFLQSYEIEELVNEIFETEIPEYTEAIYSIFSTIVRNLSDTGHNAGSGNSVPANIRVAWLLSQQARELAVEGRSIQDVSFSFRRLFGEQFPLVCS